MPGGRSKSPALHYSPKIKTETIAVAVTFPLSPGGHKPQILLTTNQPHTTDSLFMIILQRTETESQTQSHTQGNFIRRESIQLKGMPIFVAYFSERARKCFNF